MRAWTTVLALALAPVTHPGALSGRAFELSVHEPGPSSRPRIETLVPRTVRVPGAPGAPDFVIEFRPAITDTAAFGERHRVGRVTVRRDGEARILQGFDAYSTADATWFTDNAHVVDLDFDGRPDIAVLAEFGATWGRYDVWRFDPARGRFVRDALARDLARLRASRLRFDAAGGGVIRATYASNAAPAPAEEYRIAHGRLVRVAAARR